jgi:hypothetical protein
MTDLPLHGSLAAWRALFDCRLTSDIRSNYQIGVK